MAKKIGNIEVILPQSGEPRELGEGNLRFRRSKKGVRISLSNASYTVKESLQTWLRRRDPTGSTLVSGLNGRGKPTTVEISPGQRVVVK